MNEPVGTLAARAAAGLALASGTACAVMWLGGFEGLRAVADWLAPDGDAASVDRAFSVVVTAELAIIALFIHVVLRAYSWDAGGVDAAVGPAAPSGIGRAEWRVAVGVAAVAVGVALYTGSQHDYTVHKSLWQGVLAGVDPWSMRRNAYGPAFNLLAVPFAFHALAPKVLFVLAWLGCCWYLLRELAGRGIGLAGLLGWSAALPLNPLFWSHVVKYGSFDALVAGCCLLAVVLRCRDRPVAAGLVLGFAVLLKFYPIVLAPFLALDARRIDWRFAAALALTVAAGFATSLLVVGDSVFEPLVFASVRGSKILSIFRFLKGQGADVDYLSLPALALAGGALLVLCWTRRVHPAAGALAAILVTFALYHTGHFQFFLVVPLAAGYWYAHRRASASRDRLLICALIACLAWVAGASLIYMLTEPPGGGFGLNDEWWFLRDWFGLPTFVTLVWLIVAVLRHELREFPSATGNASRQRPGHALEQVQGDAAR